MSTGTPAHNPAERLGDIVGERYVLLDETPTSTFLKDWTGDYTSTPCCVVLPRTTKEVSQIMAMCHTNGFHVIPQGGNTGLVGGCHTEDRQATVIMSLARMNAIRSLDVENHTMDVDAGCIVQAVQDAASDADRLFPLAFGAQGSAQIGGAIATNAGGLNVLRYGMMRDLVLGLEVVMADGTILNTMSQLRKDNRGLDLKHLFVGTEGALGVVTGATLKLLPGVQTRETAFLALPDVKSLTKLYSVARAHCADLLTAFELIPRACVELAIEHQHGVRDPLSDTYDIYVLMELACSGPLDLRALLDSFLEAAMEQELIIDGALAESLSQVQNFWAIREAMVEAQAARGRHLRTDISVPISQVSNFIEQAQTTLKAAAPDWLALSYGHIGDGNIHFNALPAHGMCQADIDAIIPRLLALIYPIVDSLGGSISAEHGIGRNRLEAHQTRQTPAAKSLTDTIKMLLDPSGTLNPGCLFSKVVENTDVTS